MRNAFVITFLVAVTLRESPVARAQYCETGNQFGNCGGTAQESNCGCDWFDDLESYALGAMPGTAVTPVNGWENWASSGAAVVGVVSDAQNHTPGGSKSLRIDPNDDQVRIMAGGPGYGGDGGLETDGVGYDEQVSPIWTFEAWNYVPAAQSGDQFLNLLSRYDGGMGTTSWDVQTSYNAVAGVVTDYHITGLTLPIITDQWVRTEVLIDLQNDTMDFFYDDTLLFSGIWSIGDISNPFGNDPVLDKFLGVVSLFSNAATAIYWDDFSVTAPVMGPPVRYVDADAVGMNDGTSWADAFTKLQDALDAIGPGTEVWVAAGTYRPDQGGGQTPDDRSETFQLVDGVAILGGFAGTETMASQRDPVANVTVLSGDLNDDDSYMSCTAHAPDCDSFGGVCANGFCIIPDNNDENSYHVVTGSGTDGTAFFDGFTITGGNADGMGDDSLGAGMFNDGGSPRVSNCIFSGNTAVEAGAGAGGGMYNVSGAAPQVVSCTFTGNAAAAGGGMANEQSSPTVIGSEFIWNGTVDGSGGGMANVDGSSPLVYGCTFERNRSDTNGGGMRNFDGSSPMVVNCIFILNFATSDGGGMINNLSCDATVVNTRFLGNTSFGTGGGMWNGNSSHATLTNCEFSGNVSFSGGGMNNRLTSSPVLNNCTFGYNLGLSTGGGIHNGDGASPTLANCILWGNFDSGGMDESAQIHTGVGLPTVTYSIVQGGWTGAGGTGNIATDPLFFDFDGVDDLIGTIDDNLQPTAGSPAIDAGDNFSVPADVADLNFNAIFAERTPHDLAYAARFVDDVGTPDTGVADPPDYPGVVDMGAYEFFTDCNHNGIDDGIDILKGASNDLNMDDVPDECAMWNPPMVNDGFWGTAGNWAPPVVPDNVMADLFDVTIGGAGEVVTLNIDAEINSLNLLDDATLNVTLGDLNVVTSAGLIIDGTLNVTGAHTLDSAGPVVVDDSPDVFAVGGCVPPPTVSLRGTGSHSMSSLTVQECAQVFAGDTVQTLVSGPVLIGPGGFYGPDPERIDPSAADLTCNDLDITGNESDAGVFELDDTMTATVNGDVNLIDGGSPPSVPSARGSGSESWHGHFVHDSWHDRPGHNFAGTNPVPREDGNFTGRMPVPLLGGCVPPPTLQLRGFSTLTIVGSLNVSDCAEVSIGPHAALGTPSSPVEVTGPSQNPLTLPFALPPRSGPSPSTGEREPAGPEPLPSVTLYGDLINRRTVPDGFQWRFGGLLLSDDGLHNIEAAGENYGAVPGGFTNNYAIGRLELGPDSETTVVDAIINSNPGAEALYVGELVLQSGSTLTLEAPLYAGRIINNGGTILTPGQLDTIDCVTDAHCDDGTVCTSDTCSGGGCAWSPALFGDVNADGGVDIFDILCVLDGFSGVFASCLQPAVDLAPCPDGDEIIDVFDILAVLDAFSGDPGCCGP